MELSLSYFFFDLPIYTSIIIDDNNYHVFESIVGNYKREEFEGYNPWKKLESTFVVTTRLVDPLNTFIEEGGYGTVRIKCKRSDDIFWYYILWSPEDKKIKKIGQFPTVADFHISEIKQYSKLLATDKLREFTRAIGLAANGIGIGSFVYLRRIFEHLINEAYLKSKSEGLIMDGEFQKARMDEKIDLLQFHLPDFLVENKSMYSILSLGIHELDEKTCLAHFDTLRVGIEIILDEKLQEARKQKKMKIAKQKLASLKTQIKNK